DPRAPAPRHDQAAQADDEQRECEVRLDGRLGDLWVADHRVVDRLELVEPGREPQRGEGEGTAGQHERGVADDLHGSPWSNGRTICNHMKERRMKAIS